MSFEGTMMCMHYTLERLGEIRTQTDLDDFKDEVRHNLEVNREGVLINHNPNNSDDFDVYAAIDVVRRDYVERALARTSGIVEASNLLGIKNHQTLKNWMNKLGVEG